MLRNLLAVAALLVAGAATLAGFAFYIVHQNQLAVVLEFGKTVRVVEKAGLYWKLPVVQNVEYFDKRILDLDTPSLELSASDQKRLVVDAFTRYRITDPLLFLQKVRTIPNVRPTLGAVVDSSLRQTLGAATFQDIVRDKREDLMKRIAKQANDAAKDLGLEVIDVRIKRADLPAANSKSVFGRMRAEREREAAEFRAQGEAEANRIRATAEREATVIKAEAQSKGEQIRGEGDADRNRIFADAYGRDPDFFAFYRSMQAYEVGMTSKDTRMLLSPDSEFFRYFANPGSAPSGAPAKK